MQFNRHLELEGKHAFLSASTYHWIRYDDEKMATRFKTALAAAHGSDLHDLAHHLIRLKQKLPTAKKTLNMYVNDAIGFRMQPEQVLFFSPNCFGTADAIWYGRDHKTKEWTLRIHDLKTGTTKTSVNQLEIYAALFCLEYNIKPGDIVISLVIYQNDYKQEWIADPNDIVNIMAKIIHFDRLIDDLRMEASA